MREKTNQRQQPKTLDMACLACLREFEEHLSRTECSGHFVGRCLAAARHLLVWLELDGTEVRAVDNATIRRFRDHKCTCPPREGRTGLYKLNAPPPPPTMMGVHRFVAFLEESGHTAHPQEVKKGQQLLEEFLEQASAQGHTSNMVRVYGSISRHLLVWLHRSRMPLKALTVGVLNQFFEHDCLCPGTFVGFKASRASDDMVFATKKFVRFLADRKVVPDVHIPRKKPLNPELQAFHTWLRQHRGVGEVTIREYDREVSTLLVGLGRDPTKYDAARVRRVLSNRFAQVSKKHAQRLVSVMRVYLRFLSSTDRCPASLIGAVPRIGLWSLATLPRYLPMEDIERVIASCDGTRSVDVRNRAILLLLARLALRASDVRFLQLNDIDWTNAELHLRGKSQRSVRLPLPQDVGDALLEYIERARPLVPEGTVFLRSRAPHRPFAYSTTISRMVHSALKRAGVHSPNGQGAHIFRHSAATHLVRSGASLETIGALLRHERSMTTELYAKVDLPMLQQVAQPWMGAIR